MRSKIQHWLTNRVWLRRLVRGWWFGTLGFLAGGVFSAAITQRFLAVVWIGCAVMVLVGAVLTTALLVLRRRSRETNLVQRQLDATLPPVPTPQQIAAQRKERRGE